MPKITYLRPSGEPATFEVPEGTSVMQAAISNGLDGIVAECGGNCMCATCHVHVAAAWLPKLPAMSADEDALLDGTAAERRPDSRLGCQIRLGPELDGLTVTLPDRQV